MQRLVTAEQMKRIDRRAVAEWGIPGIVLMENAGRSVADAIEKRVESLDGIQVAVVCGPGNNGGDGFVITRHLLNRGAGVRCLLVGRVADLRGDARTNADILAKSGIPVEEMTAADQLADPLLDADIVIDAVFGTGLTGPARGLAADALRLVNEACRLVVSVDVPSGVNADTGEACDPVVYADLTVTMGLAKTGLLLHPGRACAGEIEVADIGIPGHLLDADGDEPAVGLPGNDDVRALLPYRPEDGHKGTFGTALLVCGARGYTGAACLAGSAAVRAGAGLVVLAVPAGVAGTVESLVVEAVKVPLPQTEAQTVSPDALDEILRHAATAQAVALGPGLTTHPETARLIHDLLPRLGVPSVVDADAVNNLAGHLELLRRCPAPLVLTPHPGELARLAGMTAAQVNADRIGVARAFAREHNVVLLLKGAPTVTALPDGRVFVNPTGNSGLGSGGTGDVLTGLIAGLLSQGAEPWAAAVAAAFLHGRAADLAADELTEYCLCAGDVVEYLADAFRSLAPPES